MKTIRIFRQIALILLTFFITSFLAEFLCRVYVTRVLQRDFVSHRHEYDAYRNHRLKPNYRFKGVYHNAQGFRRDKDVPLKKDPGTYRIFLMGGSAAYGVVAPPPFKPFRKENIIRNNETIDFYLERYLNKKFPKRRIEVINAAVTGYWTHHHLIYLNQKILHFGPDMVIFLDGHNDYYKFHPGYDQFENYYYSGKIVMELMNDQRLSSCFFLLAEWLGSRSYFWYIVQNVFNIRHVSKRMQGEQPQRNDSFDVVETYTENAEKNLLKMIERLIILLQAEGVQPVFLLQPELILDETKPLTPEEKEALAILMKTEVSYQEIKRVKPVAVQLVGALTHRYNVPFIDLNSIFNGVKERVYMDYAHLTPLGSRLLAEFVGEKIAPIIWNSGDN